MPKCKKSRSSGDVLAGVDSPGQQESPQHAQAQQQPQTPQQAPSQRLVHVIVQERRFGLTLGMWCRHPESVVSQIVLNQSTSGYPIRAFEDEDVDAFERVVQYLRRGPHNVTPPPNNEDLDNFEALATKLCFRALSAELQLEQLRRTWELDLYRIEHEQERLRQKLAEARRLATNGNFYEKGAAHPRTQQQQVKTILVDVPSDAPGTSGDHDGNTVNLGGLVNRLTLREGFKVVNVSPVPTEEVPVMPGYTRVSPRLTRLGVTLEKMSDVARIHGRGNELGRDTGALIARAVGALDLCFHRFLLRQLPTRFRTRSSAVDSRPPPPGRSFVVAEDYFIEFDPKSYYGTPGDGTLDYDPDFTSMAPEIDELFDHILDRQVFEAGGLNHTEQDSGHQIELRARFERAFALPPSRGNLVDNSDTHEVFFFDKDTRLKLTPQLMALESAIAQTRIYFKQQRRLLSRLLIELPEAVRC